MITILLIHGGILIFLFGFLLGSNWMSRIKQPFIEDLKKSNKYWYENYGSASKAYYKLLEMYVEAIRNK